MGTDINSAVRYVIIRQGLIDKLGNAARVSLRALREIHPGPVMYHFEDQPRCPWAAGVFKLESDGDTLNCVSSDWDSSD